MEVAEIIQKWRHGEIPVGQGMQIEGFLVGVFDPSSDILRPGECWIAEFIGHDPPWDKTRSIQMLGDLDKVLQGIEWLFDGLPYRYEAALVGTLVAPVSAPYPLAVADIRALSVRDPMDEIIHSAIGAAPCEPPVYYSRTAWKEILARRAKEQQ